jgi:hypothetical protein
MIVTYSDWFLPSKNEFDKLYKNLLSGLDDNGVVFTRLTGFGKFYWITFEADKDDAFSFSIDMGMSTFNGKVNINHVRSARSFISATVYALRDVGPAGGWIFHIIDNLDGTFTYYECAPEDAGLSVWSNVTDASVGTLLNAIGEGVNNTAEIIAQVGHTTSAAKLCADYFTKVTVDVNVVKDTEHTEEMDFAGDGGDYIVQDEVNLVMVGLTISANSKGAIHYKIADEWYEWEYGNTIESQTINLPRVKAIKQINIRGTTKLEIRAI